MLIPTLKSLSPLALATPILDSRGRTGSDEPSSTKQPGCSPSAGLVRAALAGFLLLGSGGLAPVVSAEIEVDGVCTLVDAIDAANLDIALGACPAGDPGSDTIRLLADVELVEVHNQELGNTGLPVVRSEIIVEADGFEVTRSPLAGAPFRVFAVEDGDLTLRNVTISGGDASGGGGFRGGAVAVYNGDLEVTDSLLTRNSALFGGGAIYGTGMTRVENTVVSDNVGIAIEQGSSFPSPASLLVVGSSVVGNDGVGISVDYAPVTVERSLVGRNSGAGMTMIQSSTYLTNSTVSGNGGTGVFLDGYSAFLVVKSSTIVQNGGSGLVNAAPFGTATLISSVVADNFAPDCSGFTSGTNNRESDGSCPGGSLMTGLDPQLKDNGGPTETHALLPGSSAIGAVRSCDLPIDQRSYSRGPIGCDAGAFEFDSVETRLILDIDSGCPSTTTVKLEGGTPGATVVVAASAGQGSLTVPGGACAGTELQIADSGIGRIEVVLDAEGEAALSFEDLDGGLCASFVQAIDLTTCDVSNVDTL